MLFKSETLVKATYNYPFSNKPVMSIRADYTVYPCALWIVIAYATVSGSSAKDNVYD
jgi:hypothetical protein